MVDATIGTTVRVRKGSREYTYEEIMIRILWGNILSVLDKAGQGKGSFLVPLYRAPPRRKGEKRG
jgi:ABC-type transporter Mla maintaining outer membrane lipid asymmetry ATPase subunit MlaF